MLRDQLVENRNPPSVEQAPSEVLDCVSPTTRRKLLVTIVERNDSQSPYSCDQDALNPSGESKTRLSNDTFSIPKPTVSQNKIAEFYLDPQSSGKAASYLRSVSERNIQTDEDDNRITIVASKSIKEFLGESQRLSMTSSQVSTENRGSMSTGSIPGPPPYPFDDDWDDELPVNVLRQSLSPKQPPEYLITKDKLLKYLRQGDSYKAQSVINYGVEAPSTEELVDTLHYCLDHINELQSTLETFVILVERCGVDVNAVDESGVSPLMKLVRLDEQKIGSYFIFFQGADALQVHSDGECPLSVNLKAGRTWVLNEFKLNQEDLLFSSDHISRQRRYLECLVVAGYAGLVVELLDTKKAKIDKDEASYLLEECKKNTKRLKEPEKTYELLYRLGAKR